MSPMNIIHREEHLCDRLSKRGYLIHRWKCQLAEKADGMRLSGDERQELKRTTENDLPTPAGEISGLAPNSVLRLICHAPISPRAWQDFCRHHMEDHKNIVKSIPHPE